jgi:hypothetical protein
MDASKRRKIPDWVWPNLIGGILGLIIGYWLFSWPVGGMQGGQPRTGEDTTLGLIILVTLLVGSAVLILIAHRVAARRRKDQQ